MELYAEALARALSYIDVVPDVVLTYSDMAPFKFCCLSVCVLFCFWPFRAEIAVAAALDALSAKYDVELQAWFWLLLSNYLRIMKMRSRRKISSKKLQELTAIQFTLCFLPGTDRLLPGLLARSARRSRSSLPHFLSQPTLAVTRTVLGTCDMGRL